MLRSRIAALVTGLAVSRPQRRSVFVTGPAVISLLDAEPDLAPDVPGEQLRALRLALRAEVVTVARNAELPDLEPTAGLGLLIVSGLVARVARVGRREAVELLGPRDLITPGENEHPSVVECSVRWEVLRTTALAQLDDRFCRAIGPWPRLTAALAARATRRARWLALQGAIDAHPTVEERLMLLLAHLGERLGRMSPEGVTLDLPLSHRLLASSIRALRPSVSAGLPRLREHGYLLQPRRHTWVVTPAGLAFVADLCAQQVVDC